MNHRTHSSRLAVVAEVLVVGLASIWCRRHCVMEVVHDRRAVNLNYFNVMTQDPVDRLVTNALEWLVGSP